VESRGFPQSRPARFLRESASPSSWNQNNVAECVIPSAQSLAQGRSRNR
jgi:hypothetical protein